MVSPMKHRPPGAIPGLLDAMWRPEHAEMRDDLIEMVSGGLLPWAIVDDYKTMLRTMGILLKRLGFENVDEASDGHEALEKLRSGRLQTTQEIESGDVSCPVRGVRHVVVLVHEPCRCHTRTC